MYTQKNYKTKAELKRALVAGEKIEVYQPNDLWGKTDEVRTGRHEVVLEGPHYPAPHTWYAQAIVVDGYIEKVK